MRQRHVRSANERSSDQHLGGAVVQRVAFGDIFLEDLRVIESGISHSLDGSAVPHRMRDTRELARDFLRLPVFRRLWFV